VKSGTAIFAGTIIIGMKPQTIGRVLGVGLRVAGRMAGQRLAGSGQSAASAPAAQPPAAVGRSAGKTAGQKTRGLARGVGGFLRPFRRIGGILWLEVTGVFFLLFVVVFAWRGVWPARASYAQGPDHEKFLGSLIILLIFLYLGVSSFWRARKR
jgi:hypothetical protein